MSEEPVDVPVPAPRQNRAARRQKFRKITEADMRMWQVNAIKNKLFTKNETK